MLNLQVITRSARWKQMSFDPSLFHVPCPHSRPANADLKFLSNPVSHSVPTPCRVAVIVGAL